MNNGFSEDGLQKYQKITNIPYLKDLDVVAAKFGVTGVIAEDPSHPGDIYFLCGSDKKRILSGDIGKSDVLEHSQSDFEFFNHSIAAFKLTGCNPVYERTKIVEYCKTVELIQNLYRDYNKDLPDRISLSGLKTLRMAYANTKNPNLDRKTFKKYQNLINQCFKIEDSFHNPQNPDFKKEQFALNGYYDPERGALVNWFRMKFGKHNNCVSKSQILLASSGTESIFIKARFAKQLKDDLDKKPNTLYYISKPYGVKLKLPLGEGFGPKKEDNDLRVVSLHFSNNEKDKKEIYGSLYKVLFPEIASVSFQQMLSEEKNLCSVAIPSEQYDNFVSLCKANGVRCCFDEQEPSLTPEILNVSVSLKDWDMTEAILLRLCDEIDDFHLYERRETPPVGRANPADLVLESPNKTIRPRQEQRGYEYNCDECEESK